MPKFKSIRMEFRFSNADEESVIENLIDENSGKIHGKYDGLIDAEVPAETLKKFKAHNILMDFTPPAEIVKEKHLFVNFRKIQNSLITKLPRILQQRVRGINRELSEEMVFQNAAEILGDTAVLESVNVTMANENILCKIILTEPLNSPIRNKLEAFGVRLTAINAPLNEYNSVLNIEQYQSLLNEDFVVSVKEVGKKAVVLGEMLESALMPPDQVYDIEVIDDKSLEQVKTEIEAQNGRIIDSHANIVRAEISDALVQSLSSSPLVLSIIPYQYPELFSDVSRQTIGLETAEAITAYTGASEIVGIIDSGIDETHPDLKSQVKAALAYGTGNASDIFGHGTHVAGIIAGNGSASGGKIKGIAPESGIVSVGVVDENRKMDIPIDVGILLAEATNKGAKIINLSWGYDHKGNYNTTALTVDQFAYKNPEVLIVVAAGNFGKATNGKLDYRTLSAPGSAKNVITVGSATSRRTSPAIAETWGDAKPESFPGPPQNIQKLVEPNDMHALNSGTGPTDYDSIKPEVLAPGNFILSAKAKSVAINPSSKKFFDDNYMFDTGTSMAAPAVSGIAALLRQFLKSEYGYEKPSSALLKAIIISCCRKIETSRNSMVGFPDFDQGFGMVDMTSLLNKKDRKLFYRDIYNTEPQVLESRAPVGGTTKSYREYLFEVNEGNEKNVDIVLCWTDSPAKSLQNNLQLSVKPIAGEWIHGNSDHTHNKKAIDDIPQQDKTNNVEKIQLEKAAPGKYVLKVTAQLTIFSPQGYGLAVLGDIASLNERP